MAIRTAFLLLVVFLLDEGAGILFPRVSKTRELQYLDGLWTFSLSTTISLNSYTGLTDDKNDNDIQFMPVPASYNDIPTTSAARDHVGPVIYQKSFLVPSSWIENERIWLRFGSVCYSAKVYINNKLAMSHETGHLPFEAEITPFLTTDENTVRVMVDNIPSNSTIPQGQIDTLPSGRKVISYTYDFFDYAGIDRPVYLYTTPKTFIEDITITTQVSGTSGIVNYNIVSTNNTENEINYKVTVIDATKQQVASSDSYSGVIHIPNANFWWPYLMNDVPGYLYSLNVDIYNSNNSLLDSYSQPFGIREIKWDDKTVKINGKAIYLRGFGRHEDADIRGKGLDLPTILRDHNLIRWIGANAYRTSHYPYAEEIMDMADKLGIMIIDESPAVNTENFNDELLHNHKQALTELYQRDKNRPSVIIWSCANEPRTQDNKSEQYYREVTNHIRLLDSSRPITIVNMYQDDPEYSQQFVDIVSFNRYNAWYLYTGELDVIESEIVKEGEKWYKKHNKPVLITEYGGDTLEGYHALPDFVWSEEFQDDLLANHFRAFDQLRKKGWFIGEMIWNFADFKTSQKVNRLGGNKKGIFTRQRQPKSSAHLVRRRYWSLAHQLDQATVPTDLEEYVLDTFSQPKSSVRKAYPMLFSLALSLIFSYLYMHLTVDLLH